MDLFESVDGFICSSLELNVLIYQYLDDKQKRHILASTSPLFDHFNHFYNRVTVSKDCSRAHHLQLRQEPSQFQYEGLNVNTVNIGICFLAMVATLAVL